MAKKDGHCVICENRLSRKLFVVRGRIIERCSKCGLVKTKGFIAPSYQDYHRDKEYKQFKSLFENIFLKRLQIVYRFIDEPGKVLEIGCSIGILLKLFKDKGWEAWGVEPSKSASVARKKGIRVINNYFQRASLPQGYFDVIILNHTLEHLENPDLILKKARGLLRKEGIILIDVPNFGSFSEKVLGKNWPYIMPEEHIWHFTPSTLSLLLKKVGFIPIHSETRSGIFDWGQPLKGLIDKLLSARKSLFSDFLTVPFAFINTKTGMGTSLSIVGKK